MITAPKAGRRSEFRVYGDAEQLAGAGAELFVECAAEAIRDRNRFRVALSGGHTPRRLYELLATGRFNTRVDWNRIDIFWGDERYVAADDHESNYAMAGDALLRHVAAPSANIYRVPTEIHPPSAAAAAYEEAIRRCFNDCIVVPQFDLIYLGLGTNGHIASLFPHSPVLSEQSRLVVADFVAEVNTWRITMTARLLNRGRTVAFLVDGRQKAEVLRAVLFGPADPQRLPAQLITPEGRLLWFVDAMAASLLPRTEERRRS